MPRIKYKDLRLKKTTLDLIHKSNAIIAEYRRQGFTLTLRQLYYQFVARDLFTKKFRLVDGRWKRDDENGTINADPNYNALGDAVSDGRMAGMIDWEAIVDRTRFLRQLPSWDSPADVVDACARQFRVDKWQKQQYRVEVWIEKDALVGVFERACNKWQVPLFSCRGYTSQTEMWNAGQRLTGYVNADQTPLILHFGDHDPSGMDMSRDIVDRLETFMGEGPLKRLALNMDQVEEFNPPPNPAKVTDSRAKAYIAEYGDESWELDAMEPDYLAKLVEDQIGKVIDMDQWDKDVAHEDEQKSYLAMASEKWSDVVSYLNSLA